MKICHVAILHPRGDQRILFKECRSLAEAGYDVHLIAPPAAEAVECPGVTIHTGPLLKRKSGMFGCCRRVYGIARREVKAEVYHIHELWLIPFALAMVWFAKKKVVYDVHEDYMRTVASRKYLPKIFVGLFGWLVSRIEAFAARRVDYIVTVVDSIASRFQRSTPRVVQVRNYMLADLLPQRPPTREEYLSRRPIILHTGSMGVSRGQDVMLDAMRVLKDRGIDAKLWTVSRFLGGGEVQSREFLERVKELDIEDRVELLPQVPHGELGNYLREARIGLSLLMPKQSFANATPTKVFEYMGYGMAMVGNRLACHEAFIERENAGLLCEYDGESLADAIAALLNDPDQAYRYAVQGYEACISRYTWESQAVALVGIYRQMGEDIVQRQRCDGRS